MEKAVYRVTPASNGSSAITGSNPPLSLIGGVRFILGSCSLVFFFFGVAIRRC